MAGDGYGGAGVHELPETLCSGSAGQITERLLLDGGVSKKEANARAEELLELVGTPQGKYCNATRTSSAAG